MPKNRARAAARMQVERLHHDRDRGRKHDRPAQALDRAERHDPGLGDAAAWRQAAQRRRAGEDDHPEHDHLAVPGRVRQAAAEGEEGGQRQQVGVDRPLHAAARQAQVVLDRGRGDRDDGLVDEGHRDREDHRRQDQAPRPAARSAADAHRVLPSAGHSIAGFQSGPRPGVRHQLNDYDALRGSGSGGGGRASLSAAREVTPSFGKAW